MRERCTEIDACTAYVAVHGASTSVIAFWAALCNHSGVYKPRLRGMRERRSETTARVFYWVSAS